MKNLYLQNKNKEQLKVTNVLTFKHSKKIIFKDENTKEKLYLILPNYYFSCGQIFKNQEFNFNNNGVFKDNDGRDVYSSSLSNMKQNFNLFSY